MHTGSKTQRAVQLTGGVAFIASLAWFAWQYATTFGVRASTDGPAVQPAVSNALWFGLFAAHHSVFARAKAKTALARLIPVQYERTLYVWVASLLFFVMTFTWQPVPGVFWAATGPVAWLLHALQVAAVVFGVAGGRLISVRDLAGITRTTESGAKEERALADHGPFGWIRHPLNLTVLLLIWPVATMTGTRLVFAACATAYILIAIPLEERDLRRGWGRAYDNYARKVRYRLIPYVY